MVIKKEVFVILLFLLAFVSFSVLSNASLVSAQSFEIENLLLKVGVRQDSSVERSFSISSEDGGDFILEVIGLEGVNLSESEFTLSPGDSRIVPVVFSAEGLPAGIYGGSIMVSDGKNVENLPVVFEVESKDIFFDVNVDIPAQYSEISPGGKLVALIRVFDLTGLRDENSIGPSEVSMEYIVKELDGTLVISESENLIVDKQTQINKNIIFPEGIERGNYLLMVTVRYKSSVGISSYLFTIDVPGDSASELFSFENLDVPFLIILVVILAFFLVIVIVFVYLIRDRDKLFVELRKCNSLEYRRGKEILLAQARAARQRMVAEPRDIEKEVKKSLKELKDKENQRVSEFKKLRKTGDRREMLRRLNEWKKQGYNTSGVELKVKGMSVKEMKREIAELKKKGYKKTKAYKTKKR